MRNRPGSLNWVVVIGVFALGASSDATARAIRVDESNPISDTNPSFWSPTSVDPLFAPVSITDIGFAVNFGQPAGLDTSKMTIFANGYLSFGETGVTPGVDSGNAIVSPVIAPFYMSSNVNLIQYAPGRVDLSGPPYSDVGAVDAFRVSWFTDAAFADGSIGAFPFQVVLFDMSDITGVAGDFDMEINYGFEFQDTPLPPYGGLVAAGFQLGTNSAAFNIAPDADPNPFVGSPDHFYSFRGGVLVGSEPPPTVPGPDSLLLAITGFGLIGLVAVRRRAKGAPQLVR